MRRGKGPAFIFTIVLAASVLAAVLVGFQASAAGDGRPVDGPGVSVESAASADLPVDVELELRSCGERTATIHASISSERDVDGARVSLILPEGAFMLDGSSAVAIDLIANEPAYLSWTVEVVTDGQKALYCEVLSAGGSLLGSASLGINADGNGIVEDQAGLAVEASEGIATVEAGRSTLAAGPVSATYTASFVWSYTDSAHDAMKPCRRAAVWLYQLSGSDYVLVDSGRTNDAGAVSFASVAGGTYKIAILADDGASVKVMDSGETVYGWITGEFTVDSSDAWTVTIDSDNRGVWEAYTSVLDEYLWLNDQVSWARSQVTIVYPVEDWPHAHGDEIHIPNTGSASTSIWDRGTLLHEYAHCVMYAMRGGSYPPGAGGSHYLFSEMNAGFALTEGWAEFMQCAVDNDPYGLDNYMPGTKIIEDVVVADYLDGSDWDGSIIEGAVANVLWDIFDGADAADRPGWDGSGLGDQVSGAFPTLWSIMLSYEPDSIDEIWSHWPGKDSYLWAVFYHARISYDSAAPTGPTGMTVSPDRGDWTNDNTITVTLTGLSDDLSGVAGFYYCWSHIPQSPYGMSWSTSTTLPTFAASDGVWYLCILAEDRAGNRPNTYAYNVLPWRIDTSVPVTTISVSSAVQDNGWNGASTIALACNDGAGSGANATWYRINDGAWQEYDGAFIISEAGSYVILYHSDDLAGNLEPIRSMTVSIDGEAPVTDREITGNTCAGWYSSAVSVELTATDAGVGLNSTHYRVDGGAWSVYSGALSFATDGTYALEYYSDDRLGNAEHVTAVLIKVDRTGPVTDARMEGTPGEGGWYVSAVTVHLDVVDEGSGSNRTVYRLDGGAWMTGTGPIRVPAEGSHVLECYSVDNASNIGVTMTFLFKIDQGAPLIGFQVADGEIFTSTSGSIAWLSGDAVGDVVATYVSIDGGAFVSTTLSSQSLSGLPDGKHVLSVRAVDEAGNEAMKAVAFTVDTSVLSPTGPMGPNLLIAIVVLVCAAVGTAIWLARKRGRSARP